MALDGTDRQHQLVGDLAVGVPGHREVGNRPLRRCQLPARRRPPTDPGQLGGHPPSPGRRAQLAEDHRRRLEVRASQAAPTRSQLDLTTPKQRAATFERQLRRVEHVEAPIEPSHRLFELTPGREQEPPPAGGDLEAPWQRDALGRSFEAPDQGRLGQLQVPAQDRRLHEVTHVPEHRREGHPERVGVPVRALEVGQRGRRIGDRQLDEPEEGAEDHGLPRVAGGLLAGQAFDRQRPCGVELAVPGQDPGPGHDRSLAPDLLATLDELLALAGVATGRRPVADQLLEDRHRLDDRREQPHLAPGDDPAVLRLIERQRLAQPADVIQEPLGPFLGRSGDEQIARSGQEFHRPVHVLEREPPAAQEPLVGPLDEGAAEQVRVGRRLGPRTLEDLDRGFGVPLAELRVGVAHDRDRDVRGRLEDRVALGMVERLEQERQCVRRAGEIDDLAERQEDARPLPAGGDLGEGHPQEIGRAGGIAGPEASGRGIDPQLRALGSRRDPCGPGEQVGGHAGGAPGNREPGGALELVGDGRVSPVHRRGPLDRPLEGVVDRLRKGAPDRPAMPGQGVGVGGRCIEGVGRPQSVPVGHQDAAQAGLVDRGRGIECVAFADATAPPALAAPPIPAPSPPPSTRSISPTVGCAAIATTRRASRAGWLRVRRWSRMSGPAWGETGNGSPGTAPRRGSGATGSSRAQRRGCRRTTRGSGPAAAADGRPLGGRG